MAAASRDTKKGAGKRPHRILVPLLVFLGALCIFISTVSVWVRDTVFNTDNWVNQSAQLLDSPDVRQVLAVYIVDQSYAASDAQARLEAALPENLKPLAGPILAQLQGVAYNTVATALTRPRVQALWETANRAQHAQLVALLEGNTDRVKLTNDAVVLDLDAVAANVAERVGASTGATETVQQHLEPVVLLQSDQLTTVQKLVKWIKALSIWPLLIGLLLWAGAAYLAADRRRRVIRAFAISLVIIGLLLLVVRRLGGDYLVDSLVKTDSVKAAAHDVWTIYTQLLADSAIAGVVVGLLTIAALWVAGPARRATAIRRWLAPTFRDRPIAVHAVLAVAILLLLVWGPVGTPRRLVTLLIVIALAFIGLEVLRRQTIREFPDATREGRSLTLALSRSSSAATNADDTVDKLERLASLHERGALTDEEYQAEKALLLG